MRFFSVSRFWLSIGFALGLSIAASADPAPRTGWDFFEAGMIPVQSGGRVKPLDTVAREAVLFTTGSRSFQGWAPIEMLLSWVTAPQEWRFVQFIQISRLDVRRQLNLDEKRTRFSPDELLHNFSLAQYAQRMGTASQVPDPKGVGKANAREQELRRVMDRLMMFQNTVSGETLAVVPAAQSAQPWSPLARMDDQSGMEVRSGFLRLFHAYLKGDPAEFTAAVKACRELVEGKIPGNVASVRSSVHAEALYYKYRPFLIAWVLYLLAALLWAASYLSSAKIWNRAASLSLGLALLSQSVGIGVRCYIAGRPPVTNMYESIIWVSLGVVFFALILYALHRQRIALLVASVVATLGLIAADAAPTMMDPGIHPLVPVLRSNYWLTIHVLTITLGYAAFALTLGLANVTLFHFARRAPGFLAKTENLNQLTYRAMQFGVVLLAAGTILGGVWADYSWGRFWGWDPKEVWALIALLCYLAILHARFTGWIGQFGYTAWTVASFLSVIMAWYGVNFVLGVGLHSYGFSSGGLGGIIVFVALQLGYVIVAGVRYRSKSRLAAPDPSIAPV